MLLFLCFNNLLEAQNKDTLFFNNGTIVIGEVKRVKLGVVTFDPDDANDITVQLRKLKTVYFAHTIFRIELLDHRVIFGFLRPHPSPNTVYVRTLIDSFAISLQDISILYPFESTIMQRISGSVGLGFNYTKSSEFGRLNFDASLNYVAKQVELGLAMSGIYTLTDTSFTRDKEDMSVKGNYYFIRSWFATVFVAYQRNLELGLTRRYQEGFGVGNKFITAKRTYSWARTGIVFNQEANTEGDKTNTLAELFGQIEVNFFQFSNPEISVVFAQSIYYSLSQSGRFRNDGNTSFSWEIFNDFVLSLEFYHSYDSKPPVENSSKIDYGTVIGVKYKF